MIEVQSSLCGNAIRCMDLLHRLVAAWLVLSIVAAFLPATASSAQLKLPYTDVNIPVNSARWTCAVVIFFTGIVGCTILKQLRGLCLSLAQSDHLAVVLTYPSMATLGTPRQRMLFGYALAFVQYSVGYELWSPMPRLFGGAPDIALAFLYAGPMFWLAWDLRDWQKSVTPESALPKTPMQPPQRSDA